MTRPELVKHIRKRLEEEYGLEASRELVNAILSIEEDEIYTIVALNDSFKYLWGTISGVSRPPKKVSGKFREVESIKNNHGYSSWKNGYPKIKWSRVMKVYDIHTPEEYFELPEHRYTTEARTFRQEAGLPEIDEYKGLPEEKIIEYCQRADKIEFEKLSKNEQYNKMRDNKFNKMKQVAVHKHWEEIGHTPMGATDEDWTGDNNDTIDYYLMTRMKNAKNAAEQLDVVLSARDIAEWKNELQDHPELDDLEKQYRAEMEKQGLKPIPHVKKDYHSPKFKLKYNGEENPWNILNVTPSIVLHQQRMERLEREKEKLLEDVNNSEKEEEK